MKRTSNPWRFDAIFYAVSTSLLLATPVETFAFELQEQASFAGLLQPPAVPQLSLDPVTASGLSLGTLSAFSERMSERHGQAAPDLSPASGRSSSRMPQDPAPKCPRNWRRPANN